MPSPATQGIAAADWDGGLFSNTPLEYVLDYYPRRSRLTVQVDVFQPAGCLPSNLDEAMERDKDIRYASRTQTCTQVARDKHHVRHAINELHKLLPAEIAKTEQAKQLYELGCVTEMDIVQLIYRSTEPEGSSKDYEFSRSRWKNGSGREWPMRKPCCARRHGWRRCQRSSVCAFSIWTRLFRPKRPLTVAISRPKRMRNRPNGRQRRRQHRSTPSKNRIPRRRKSGRPRGGT